MTITVEWKDSGREPQCAPDPAYPNGKPIRLTDQARMGIKTCEVALPYPAKRCGLYCVKCDQCGLSVGVTTAGRPDDPVSVELACGPDTVMALLMTGVDPYER